MKDKSVYQVSEASTIKEAIRQMDLGGIGFCVCVDRKENVVGVISDGDFRRAVLKGLDLDDSVEVIMNRDYTYLPVEHDRSELEKLFLHTVVQRVPIVEGGKLVDLITSESFFGVDRRVNRAVLDNPVVIMAGGEGKRLDPFTRILPKPLIPLGDEPIIKLIMNEFAQFGISDFHISLNDKGRMIKAYFHDHELPYNIEYLEEDKPLGTAGALRFLLDKVDQPIFVSNCDVIVHSDYAKIVEFHADGGYDFTLVASMRHYVVPYGVCEMGSEGELRRIVEKPEYDFFVNTGFYLINPEVLGLIPADDYFDMTDLIGKIQSSEMRIGVFPVSEKSWADIGQWDEYRDTLEILSHRTGTSTNRDPYV